MEPISAKCWPRTIQAICAAAACVFVTLTASVSHSEPAPGYDASMPQPGPYEQNLDALLAAHDTDALNRAVLLDVKDLETATRGLNWLRAKQIVSGGSSHVAYLYSLLSWRMSDSVPEPAKTHLKQNAVTELLLTRWLILSEGFQCADATAPGARSALLTSQTKVIADYFPQITETDVTTITHSTFELMLLTFKKRENDVWLCRGGANYIVKYFSKHPDEKGTDISIPGSVGTNRMLPVDPTILPDFIPYDRWKDKRHTALDEILRKTGGNPTADYYLDAEHRME